MANICLSIHITLSKF